MKKILLFSFLPLFSLSQIQIGNTINGKYSQDQSGNSVALSDNGNILAIGTSNNVALSHLGYVSIYQNSNGTWSQIGDDIVGENTGDKSGYSVALSSNGTIVAIGSPYSSNNGQNSGSVRLFFFNGITWGQIGATLTGANAGDLFGYSVSLSDNGKTVAIGAKNNDGNGNNSGEVRVFKNINGEWIQLGNAINGENANDESGSSISLSADGTILAIGAEKNNGNNGAFSGHVRIFQNTTEGWIQVGNDIDGENANDFSGTVALSANGQTIAIGAKYNDENGAASGHVRVFENTNGTWTQIGNDIDGQNEGDQSGGSVSISNDGHIIAIGAIGNNTNGNYSGQVRVFQKTGNNWLQIQNDINGTEGSTSGSSVSLSSDGNIVAIGATKANNNLSGAVKLYSLNTNTTSLLHSNSFSNSNFVLYPNPTSEILNIRFENDATLKNVIFYNNLGQIVKTSTLNTISITDLAKGIYQVEIISTFGKEIKSIIIN
ncbi:conserved hypothetical protein [Flavobacterium sp. 9AF]|uniref:T9SS type A sorting domain-containing protein n=1 Tax=Flavobacterium sp. 9AF TaxID=2653142 RepID=UPI0012F02CEE|nr:T9SS type A sorting domain-containing protein [Flavobacterium sp. 9AF]VXC14791.1 conserved hypothetical protein [Flavobacterium sp. 9AF]